MPYRYEEEKSVTDLCFTAEGEDLEEVFRSSWEAAAQATGEYLETVEAKQKREIELEEEDLEFLLYDFLGEFIYYKDAEGLLLLVQAITVTEHGTRWRLHAEAYGEELDPHKHGSGVDIKAVTLHEFSLCKDPNGIWRARVLMDI
jgi:SHS2 domain-containing protein